MSRPRRILFICTSNRVRSVTARLMYENNPDLEVRSAGVDLSSENPVTSRLLDWADQTFVFERRQRSKIRRLFPKQYARKSIKCLYVESGYDVLQLELVDLLVESLVGYLGFPVQPIGVPHDWFPLASPERWVG